MRKIAMLAAMAAIGVPSFVSAQPGGDLGGGHNGGGFMQNLTDEQKACIEEAACPKFERKKPDGSSGGKPEKGEKPAMPEMTEEERAQMEEVRECQSKAFESCGIQMPARSEGGKQSDGRGRGRPNK